MASIRPNVIRTPTWVSQRRMLEQKLSDLHKCSNLNHVKQIQAQIFKTNLHQDLYVVPKLILAFSLCRQMALALNAFYVIPQPNVHLYNTLIRAYIHNSQYSQAFSIFIEMQYNGVFPDNFTYPFVLKACTGQSALHQVQMIHTHIVKFDFYSDIFVPNALIDSYSKCEETCGINAAKKLFDAMPERDIVSWNSLISGLIKSDELGKARKLFEEMPERDAVSWNTILDGYVKAGDMNAAFELFKVMPDRNVVSWSTMISGYSKADDMEMANTLFNKMPVKTVIPWTIMISGYAEKGLAKQAYYLYDQMMKSGMKPDDGSYISILAASAKSGLLRLGKRIHISIQNNRLRCSTQVHNALIDMYAKCGDLGKAMSVFYGMVKKDVVSWNSMIQGLAMHGHGERALDLFSRMKQEEATPDGVTFVGVLCACTHVGLVSEGLHYFSIMEKEYNIVPKVEHYGCMIDLLGRGGCLDKAFELIHRMPMEPNAIIWGTLLGACRMHNDVELAEKVVERLVKLEPSDVGNYTILSNIYAAAGNWNDLAKARLQMKHKGIQKEPGASSVEVDDEVHEFTVADRSHPQSSRIYNMIDRLGQHLRHAGYVPRAQY